MLLKQLLRFVLADDPSAGKTITAGLQIRGLIIRGDDKRILIVSPGSLTEQWQDELLEKFGVTFDIFSRKKQEQCAAGNYFDEAVQQFTSKLGAEVSISVEIQTPSDSGFDEALQRTTNESCNVLKFFNNEFE